MADYLRASGRIPTFTRRYARTLALLVLVKEKERRQENLHQNWVIRAETHVPKKLQKERRTAAQITARTTFIIRRYKQQMGRRQSMIRDRPLALQVRQCGLGGGGNHGVGSVWQVVVFPLGNPCDFLGETRRYKLVLGIDDEK